MNIYELLRPVFVDGYAASEKNILTMCICVCMAFFLGFYICCIYRRMCRQVFYDRNFNLSVVVLAVITAAIILTIQSNIVVSLGMVGALSIVRFRTAVKDPLDLIFLFWSISTGIICGAGYVMIALILAAVVTVAIFVFDHMRAPRSEAMILVIDADSVEHERAVMEIVERDTAYCKVQARSATREGLHLTIEVRTETEGILHDLLESPMVRSASLVRHDGEVTV